MKIKLVIEDYNGKNILFITDSGKTLTVNEVVDASKNGMLENTHMVNPDKTTAFIRSNPNKTGEDNLDAITISLRQLEDGLQHYDAIKDLPAIQVYEKIRQENIKIDYEDYIFVDDSPRRTKEQVISQIEKYQSIIVKASENQMIDPAILGAILIDEYCRMGLDDWFDWMAILGKKTSIGIGQVNIETARNLIKQGLYNPNPHDEKLSPQNINKISKAHLYTYLRDPLHSINLSAAKIKYDINRWHPKYDVSNRPDLLGTLYSLGDIDVHNNPESNNRGTQINTEFYPMAKNIFTD